MNDLVDISKVQDKSIELAQEIIDETDFDKSKNLINLFNATQSKKNVLRILKLSELLDTISDKIQERIEKRGDELTSQELLQCLQVITNTVEKANKDLMCVQDTPIISLQQNNQINVNMSETLTRESREKITSLVQSILNKANDMQYPILNDIEITEVVDE